MHNFADTTACRPAPAEVSIAPDISDDVSFPLLDVVCIRRAEGAPKRRGNGPAFLARGHDLPRSGPYVAARQSDRGTSPAFRRGHAQLRSGVAAQAVRGRLGGRLVARAIRRGRAGAPPPIDSGRGGSARPRAPP